MAYRYCHLPELHQTPLRQHIVVFSGSGISAESGIDTFRGHNGLWLHSDYKKVASAGGYYENPQHVLDFFNNRRRQLMEAQPNHAHCLIRELESWHDITIITQNVDDLHERAGSSTVIHLHGELTKVTSSSNRLDPICIKEYPLDIPIKIGDKAADGSQLRPSVVMFGEYPSNMTIASSIIKRADIFVVIGTSLKVHPAAGLLKYADHSIPKFIIDPNELQNDPSDFEHIRMPATLGIERFIDRLLELTL